MEIYVDVKICNKKPNSESKFLFSTFSYGHDIYLLENVDISQLDLVTMYFIRASGPTRRNMRKGDALVAICGGKFSINDVWLRDPDYGNSIIRYALTKELIPKKFNKWLNKFG